MTTPVLHLLAGPNGAGKTTLVERVLQPVTHLPFVNADRIAAEHWPGFEEVNAYAASRLAEAVRQRLMLRRSSFIAETVFSHQSKLALMEQAARLGYLVHLHVVMIPVDLAVARVHDRVRRGGHNVPEPKIRARYDRMWPLVVQAVAISDRAVFYDNSRAADPLRTIAQFEQGQSLDRPDWPGWVPDPVRALGI